MSHPHRRDAAGSIRTAFFLNLGFTLVEIAGGILTNSLAILSDALHDLGDSFSIGLSWYLEKKAGQGGNPDYSYGLRRLSLLAALINAVVLVTGSLLILALAVPRLLQPQAANAAGMLGLALLGIAVNGIAVLRLRAGRTLNEKVLTWHLLEDVLGWVAVLIVSIALLITDLYILDPLLSILITLYVLYNVARHLGKTLTIFLQGVPADVNLVALEKALAGIPGVRSVHRTHAWSLDGEHHVFSTHLVVPAEASKAEILAVKAQALRLMREADLAHSTIEIEYEDETCRMRE